MGGKAEAAEGCRILLGGVEYALDALRLNVRFFSYFGGEFHSHPYYHFILVSGNACNLVMRFGRRRETVVCPHHSLVFINPVHEHAFTAEPSGTEHTGLVVALRDRDGRACTEGLERVFGRPDAAEQTHRVVTLTEFEADEFASQHRLASSARTEGLPRTASAALFHMFLLASRLVLREVFAPPPTSTRNEAIVAAARAIIEGNFHAPDFNVGILASQLKFHPNHLNHIFRKTQKITAGEYIIRRRIRHARQLLSVGTRVKEAAFLCGYRNQSHFAALFRKRTGYAPSHYHAQEVDPKEETTLDP